MKISMPVFRNEKKYEQNIDMKMVIIYCLIIEHEIIPVLNKHQIG